MSATLLALFLELRGRNCGLFIHLVQIHAKNKYETSGGVRELCRGTQKYMQKTSTKPQGVSGNYVEEPENTCKKQVHHLRVVLGNSVEEQKIHAKNKYKTSAGGQGIM